MSDIKAAATRGAVDHDRRRFLKGAGSLALLSGGAVVLAGCGVGNGNGGAADGDGDGAGTDEGEEADAPGDASAGGELDEVIFLSIVPPESLTFSPELLGISAGYFEENGLNIRLEPTRGSAQAVQGILSELALISRVGDIEVMLGIGERGADELVNLGTLYKDSTIRFVSHPDDPITTAEDFAGKLIGIPSEGGTSELTVDLVALSAGIEELDKQVVGLSPGTYDLVEEGRIAAYAVSLDTAVLLEETRGAVVFSPGDAIFAGGQCYMGNRAAIEREDDVTARDIVERFMEAVQRSVDEIIGDQENGFENVIAKLRERYSFDSLMNDDVVVGAMEQYVKSWTLDGPENVLRTTEDRWQGVYDELVEAGSLEPGQDPSEWFSNEFVDD